MLPRSFFERDPIPCARDLIGCELIWGEARGIVVETEAYDAEDDPACHTFSRPSARAFVAKHPPGTAYVYFNYGVHWMLNVLVKGNRQGFVLIRALEPVAGLDAMILARGTNIPTQLCSGPGKLARALGVTGDDHGLDLCSDPQRCFLAAKASLPVAVGPRIGISRAMDFPWRFHVPANRHVSHFRSQDRPRPSHGRS